MDRVAVFVDAGYLFAQGSVALSGNKLPRGGMLLDSAKAIQAFENLATRVSGLPLLRVYWYDGTSTGPTPQHLALAHISGVKMRLGFVNSIGEQKGVDSLIVADMITLAKNHAMADAVLLSGDEDLRVGVQLAQEYGVRVHLIGIKPIKNSQSLFLHQEADTTHEWGIDEISEFLSLKTFFTEPVATMSPMLPPWQQQQPVPETDTPAGATTPCPLETVAKQVAADIPESELPALIEAIRDTGQTPKEIDGQLLAKSRTRLESPLNSKQKSEVRKRFLEACEQRLRAAWAPQEEEEYPTEGDAAPELDGNV